MPCSTLTHRHSSPEDAGQRLVQVLLIAVAVAGHILAHLSRKRPERQQTTVGHDTGVTMQGSRQRACRRSGSGSRPPAPASISTRLDQVTDQVSEERNCRRAEGSVWQQKTASPDGRAPPRAPVRTPPRNYARRTAAGRHLRAHSSLETAYPIPQHSSLGCGWELPMLHSLMDTRPQHEK